jgi:hypothetical protein
MPRAVAAAGGCSARPYIASRNGPVRSLVVVIKRLTRFANGGTSQDFATSTSCPSTLRNASTRAPVHAFVSTRA